jgi:hypothetical protein
VATVRRGGSSVRSLGEGLLVGERALRNLLRAPAVIDDVSLQRRIIVVLATVGAGGCVSHVSSPAASSNDPASTACQQAVPTGHMIGASPTTVQQVRARTGGPGNTLPAAKPWRDLPRDQFAAWSVTDGARFVTFMEQPGKIWAFPQAPAIP